MTMVFGRPMAVTEFVIPIVIDAVDRVFSSRSFSHVREEVDEIEPSFADRDASASVPSELCGFLIEASLLHFGPRGVCYGHSGFAHRSVTMAGLGDSFTLGTSATGCMSTREIVSDDDGFVSAIAETEPTCVCRLDVREFDDGQTAKALTSEILESAHV